jgi:lipopolysaccharide transport system ATP-binding protein
LIEVGSGFHPELTGRENVFLSGSILGMRRREIGAKLDRIIEFAGVRRFIDLPVKRYSSGMYVRLGFAIAAHLDPDILLLDEVLAVGDAAFQSKCLTRIKELQRNGTTIVFISHDLNAVERLCDRVLLVQEGQIKSNGYPQEVIEQYKRVGSTLFSTGPRGLGPERKWQDLKAAPSNGIVRLRSIRVRTEDGQTTSAVDIRQPVGVELVYDVLKPGHILVPNYHFYNEERLHLFAVQEVGSSWRRRPRPVGQYVSTAWIPGNFFSESGLTVDVAVSSHIPAAAVHVMEHDAVAFRVHDSLEKDSARGDYTGPMPGLIRPLVDWTTHFSPCGEITEPGVEELNTV